MSAKYFLDTNIFIYTFDGRSPSKQKKAQSLIGRTLSDGGGAISFQVVQEFCHVALKKFEKPFSVKECKTYLDEVLSPLCEIYPSMDLYRMALDIRDETGFGFYDCLIIASAVQGGCKTIYSEDLQSGRRVLGITIQNPF